MKQRILVVDDNWSSRAIAKQFMNQLGNEVFESADPESAINSILNDEPQVIILDWKMPKLSGNAVIAISDDIITQLKNMNPASIERHRDKIKIILYTSEKLQNLKVPTSRNFHIFGYIYKGWNLAIQMRKFNSLMSFKQSKVQKAEVE